MVELTAAEVAKHKSRSDLWFIIRGKVYNVTKFIDEHPGGEEVMLEYGGADATDAFEDVGHSESARELLDQYLLGPLVGSSKAAEKPVQSYSTGNKNVPESDVIGAVTRLLIPLSLVVIVVYYKFFH